MSFAFLPLFTGDYLRDTRSLSPLKHGVYLLLLIYCWDTKGPVPLEEQDAAAITNCRSADEIDALRYVLGKYFTRCEDGFYNERMQNEIATSQFISKKRSEAGKMGAEARVKHRKIKELKQVLSKSQASAKQLPVTPTLTITPTLTPTTTLTLLPDSVDTSPTQSVGPHCPVKKIVELWNSTVGAAGGQKAMNLSKARTELIVRRWREVAPASTAEGLTWFEQLFRDRIAASKFCTGRQPGKDGRVYRIGIDTAMRSELQLDQIAEGKYA